MVICPAASSYFLHLLVSSVVTERYVEVLEWGFGKQFKDVFKKCDFLPFLLSLLLA